VRSAAITAVYGRRVFVNWLTGWSWSLTLLANGVVAPLIGMAIWTKAAPGRTDVVTYFAALLVVTQFTATASVHTFSGTVYDGQLTDALLRPHSVVLSQLGWDAGILAFNVVFLAPLIAALRLLTPAGTTWSRLAAAVPATVLAAGCAFAFGFGLACSAFWTQRYFAAADAGVRLVFLFGGVAAPIPLLPEAMRPWFAVLPFRAMRGFPAEVAAGLTRGSALAAGYALQVVWLAALALGARAVFRAGVRRYTALGG